MYISKVVEKSLIRIITLNRAKLGKTKKSKYEFKSRTTEIMLHISVIMYLSYLNQFFNIECYSAFEEDLGN